MAMLHKETSKMVAHRMADLKAVVPQGGGQGQGGPARRCSWSDAAKKAMVAHKGMVQKMAWTNLADKKGTRVPLKSPIRRIQKKKQDEW